MKKPLLLTLVLIMAISISLVTPAFANGHYFGLSNQNTFTRWYEYPGVYYEEEFSFFGVVGGYQFAKSQLSNVDIHYGGELGIYPFSSVTNWKSDKESALAARIALHAQLHYNFTDDFGLVTKAALAYLLGSGSGGMDQEHQEDFGVYLPTIDLGIGIRWMGHKLLGADALSITYQFSVADLGIETDNWVVGTPVSENWENTGLTMTLEYGL